LEDWSLGVDRFGLAVVKLMRDLTPIQPMLCYLLALPMSFIGCVLRCLFSSSLLFLRTGNDSRLDWFKLGMTLEKTWILCSKSGLSFQPMGQTFLLYQNRVIPQGSGGFSKVESHLLERVSRYLFNRHGLRFESPQLCFRVGYRRSANSDRLSIRRPVDVVIQQIVDLDVEESSRE